MIEIRDKKKCCGCGTCEQVCPRHCISMVSDKEGFLYPRIDLNKCVKCGLCDKVCQYINKTEKKNSPISQYYFVHNDELVRRKSSSGGVFICLAEEVIKQGGVVFGASFDEKFNVEISYAENLNECWKFVGSKYAQARVGNAYQLAKKFLLENRAVLFSGTPCQINGLEHYLGKKYDNLIKLDLTCHGIPSPSIWQKYLKSISGEYPILSVNFKDKEVSGWNNYGLTIVGRYGNKERVLVSEGNRQNTYMKGFIQYLYNRPSCSNCVSKSFSSGSDIMIGDFWNVEKYHSGSIFNDDKGVSIALAISEKGNKYLQKLRAYGQMDFIPFEEIEVGNLHACVVKSMNSHPFRAIFFLLNGFGLPLKINICLCVESFNYIRKLRWLLKRLVCRK